MTNRQDGMLACAHARLKTMIRTPPTVALGLADAVGDVQEVCQQKFGAEIRLREIARPYVWFRRQFGVVTVPDGVETALSALEVRLNDRFWWGRLWSIGAASGSAASGKGCGGLVYGCLASFLRAA